MTATTTPRPLDAAGLAGGVLCCALWGGNAVAAKFCIAPDGLPPLGGAAIRFAWSLPVVAFVCARGGTGFLRPWRDAPLFLLHGLLTAMQIGLFNWGTSHSEAGRSSVFINIHPFVTAPLAWFLLGEHLGVRGLAGLFAAAVGVVVILSRALLQGGGLTGDLVVIASGLVFGIQTIAQKLTFPRISPRTLLFGQTAIALVLIAIASALSEPLSSYHWTRASFWGVFYQGVGSSGLCFSLWLILLGRYSASRMATITFLTPIFGISMGSALRGEPLTPTLVIGGALVGLGIVLVAGGKPIESTSTPTPAGLLAGATDTGP